MLIRHLYGSEPIHNPSPLMGEGAGEGEDVCNCKL